MAEVVLRAGLDPQDPDAVVLAVSVDPVGPPGERAVARIGDRCRLDQEDRVAYVLQTEAWADRRLEDGVLTVDILAYPPAPGTRVGGIDAAEFPDRSPRDPGALRLLRVTGTTTHDTLPAETLVYLNPLDRVTGNDWPLVFAPPPEE